eukprot:244360_1
MSPSLNLAAESTSYIYPVLLLLIYPALSYFVPDYATAGSWGSAKTQCENTASTLATVPADNYNDRANEACHYYCDAELIAPDKCRCWIGLSANLANDPFTYDDGTMINNNSYGFGLMVHHSIMGCL